MNWPLYNHILAWETPWTEDPARLIVHEVARVIHDLLTKPPPHMYNIHVDKESACNVGDMGRQR